LPTAHFVSENTILGPDHLGFSALFYSPVSYTDTLGCLLVLPGSAEDNLFANEK